MKKVITQIPDNETKFDWVKIRCKDVIEIDEHIGTLTNWIEQLNTKKDSPVTEEAYGAIDQLNVYLESFRRL